MTFLPIITECDNFRPLKDGSLALFYLSLSTPAEDRQLVGLLRPDIVELLVDYNARCSKPAFEIGRSTTNKKAVGFNASVDTPDKRSAVMRELGHRWRDDGLFADVIGGRLWRDELYAVRASPFLGWSPTAPPAFVMERVVCALFGIVTYGVHLTCYTPDYRFWVPRRSKTKQTWPGYLDNTVAGGMPAGLTPFDSILKEAMEEASLPEDFVRQHIKAVGSVTYFFQTPKSHLQPEVQYVYDLCIPDGADIVPKPHDDEVESFELCTVDEVKRGMLAGHFKPNCALVLVDFLIRHGFITAENEPNYLEIITRLHGRFDWDHMHL
ncbi:hypothetical protein EXIGLDRAFT_733019 [Exidia glandulosa HHB12029]|uniref:Nudix hydrolase domain-containing protein n=1 Tax=Exidia glandulosa HHB12029 TaxID=1314781 RepID=A0A165BE20_EXIGL|nr:hypothetical protein EXIGLDRAFT_733019 [Exidia glandulosa HHB12029]